VRFDPPRRLIESRSLTSHDREGRTFEMAQAKPQRKAKRPKVKTTSKAKATTRAKATGKAKRATKAKAASTARKKTSTRKAAAKRKTTATGKATAKRKTTAKRKSSSKGKASGKRKASAKGRTSAAATRATASRARGGRASGARSATDVPRDVLKSVEEGQRAAVDAVHKFIDTVDRALPRRGQSHKRRQEIVDSAMEMADRLVAAQYDLLRKAMRSAGRTMGDSRKR
jgi:hypothetical protein